MMMVLAVHSVGIDPFAITSTTERAPEALQMREHIDDNKNPWGRLRHVEAMYA